MRNVDKNLIILFRFISWLKRKIYGDFELVNL